MVSNAYTGGRTVSISGCTPLFPTPAPRLVSVTGPRCGVASFLLWGPTLKHMPAVHPPLVTAVSERHALWVSAGQQGACKKA